MIDQVPTILNRSLPYSLPLHSIVGVRGHDVLDIADVARYIRI